MSSPSSWDGRVFQSSLYIGVNVENILYGVELLLYLKTLHIISSDKRTRRASDKFYAIFSSMITFMTTVWIATQAAFGQQMWILNSNFPGGPDAYWLEHFSDWYMDWGTTAIIVLQLMTDALMIYRCRIVWNSYCAIIMPTILWLATLVLGILSDWASSVPGGNIFIGIASQFGLAYWTVSVFLNTMLTTMICYRIIRHGKRVQEHLGREYASLYFTILTMVIESVLPYSICGIAFLVSYGMGSPTSMAIGSVYIMMMCISPQLLILRAIVGRSWGDVSSKAPAQSTIRFSLGTIPASQQSESTETGLHNLQLSNVYLPDGDDKV